MNPIAILKKEHSLIERAIEKMCLKVKDCLGKTTCVIELAQFIDFLSSYTDLCHHGKEERILFNELKKKPLSTKLSDFMESLEFEHVSFRKLVEKMGRINYQFSKGNFKKTEELENLINGLCAFFKQHEQKEETEFFPQAMKFFSESEQARLLERFKEFDQAVMHKKYSSLIKEIEEKI